MILLVQILLLPLYTMILSLIMIVLCVNSTKLKKKYKIDSLFIYMFIYLANFIIDSLAFAILPYYILQIIHTFLLIFLIYCFSNRQIIGLTGGIACGKSTASEIIRESLHLDVIDCDQLSRNIVKPGRPAYTEIIRLFGQEILLKNEDDHPEIDRPKLGELVFKDQKLRRKLMSITSYYIFLELIKELYSVFFVHKKKEVVIDAPILFESGYLPYLCYPVMLVYVTEESIQINRMKERNGFTEEHARDRIRSQMKIEDKIKKSDILINNEGTVEELKSKILKNLPLYLI